MQRPAFCTRSGSGYLNGFTNAVCTPSLASNGKATCQWKKSFKRASLPDMESILLQVQLCWAGHITRMEDICVPKAVFFSELQEGECDRGAPRKHYKDQLKRQLAQVGISHQSWQQEALDQDSWHSSVRKASCDFEAERHEAAKEKAGGRKSE